MTSLTEIKTPVPDLSKKIVTEFCGLCNWAYEVWMNHHFLFDQNLRADALQSSRGAIALWRLNMISHEYSLQQIAKLHDKAVVSGRSTLGINFIVAKGRWNPIVLKRLKLLADQLNHFADGLRPIRNKMLAHNDVTAFEVGGTLGGFTKGEDLRYFQHLQEFVNIVHGETIGGPYPFNDLVETDVADLMAMISIEHDPWTRR